MLGEIIVQFNDESFHLVFEEIYFENKLGDRLKYRIKNKERNSTFLVWGVRMFVAKH